MTKRSRNPVSSFGPEMLAVLVKGSRERIVIPFDSQREMQFFQLRIHTLRGSMARENHPQHSVVQRARTSRQWDIDKATGKPHNFRLVIEPNDLRFRAALEAAGVVVEEKAMDDVLADEAAPETPVDPSTEPALVDPSTDPYASFKKG